MKTILLLGLFLSLLVSMGGFLVVNVAEADDGAFEFLSADASALTISNLSVENRTYDRSEIPLCFCVNEVASKLSYELTQVLDQDGLNITNKVSITGNTTLTNLIDGNYCLRICAEDFSGSLSTSEVVQFCISTAQPRNPLNESPLEDGVQDVSKKRSENYAFVILMTIFAILIVGSLGLVVYNRKKNLLVSNIHKN